jgi:hypothetical protein
MGARIAAATLLVPLLVPGQHARAAEPKVITLSCDGTFTDTTYRDANPEPMKNMGVVVNLDARTVSFMGYVARIKDVDEANISFGGSQIGEHKEDYRISITGDIDRVTGHMIATTTTSDPTPTTRRGDDDLEKFLPAGTIFHYDVLCKVTNRLF